MSNWIQSAISPSTQALIEQTFLWYFSTINILYTLFLFIAFFNILFRVREVKEENTSLVLKSDSLPSILFIIPLHNEEVSILPNLLNVLSLTYRYKQIIAVNDGSTDDTLNLLKEKLGLVEVPKYYEDVIPTQEIRQVYQSKEHPEITVIDKVQGRKFDAINAAINAASTPFFVVLDADTFIDSKQFESLVRPILTSRTTVGVGASIRIMNGCEIEFNRIQTASFPKNFLPAAQSLEYLRAFCLRDGLDVVNGNFIIAGAFSIFPRDLIIQAGGFGPSQGEDVEIIVRLHRLMREKKIKYRIQYFPDPVAYTLAPTTLKELGGQRSRWHLGLLESIWYHKKICFNPKYGFFGMFGFPFWLFCEGLEPLVESLGLLYVLFAWAINILHVKFFLLLLAVTIGYTALYTIFALAVEEFTFRQFPSLRSLWMLLIANFIENLGYRQLTLLWRLRGFYWFFTRFKQVRQSSEFIGSLVKKAQKKIVKRSSKTT